MCNVLHRPGELFAVCILCVFFWGIVSEDSAAVQMTEVLPKWEAYLQKALKEWEVPGVAVAIVHEDTTVYAKGFGVRELGKSEPVTPETIFRIGSTSKAFTAALVGMEVDDGKLGWNDPVIDHKPDFAMYDPWVTRQIQVWDLMAQHSGMPAYAGDYMAMLGFDRAHIIHAVRFIKPISSFRADYAYVNNLWLVAGDLIAAISGKSWETSLSERILSPLGMTATTCSMQDYQQAQDKAVPHNRFQGELSPYLEVCDWTYIYNPAGGINSNVRDMSRWIRLMLGKGVFEGKRLLSEASVEFIISPKTVMPAMGKLPPSFYCQGWVYTSLCPHPIIWHTGGTSGMSTLVMLIPDLDMGFVCLTNSGGNNLSLALGLKLYDQLVGAAETDWSATLLENARKSQIKESEEEPKKPENSAPPLDLKAYAGIYDNPLYGPSQVDFEDNSLRLQLGLNKQVFALTPWNRDIFTFNDRIFNDDTCFVSFENEPEGITGFNLDCLDNDGIGDFTRRDQHGAQ